MYYSNLWTIYTIYRSCFPNCAFMTQIGNQELRSKVWNKPGQLNSLQSLVCSSLPSQSLTDVTPSFRATHDLDLVCWPPSQDSEQDDQETQDVHTPVGSAIGILCHLINRKLTKFQDFFRNIVADNLFWTFNQQNIFHGRYNLRISPHVFLIMGTSHVIKKKRWKLIFTYWLLVCLTTDWAEDNVATFFLRVTSGAFQVVFRFALPRSGSQSSVTRHRARRPSTVSAPWSTLQSMGRVISNYAIL